MSWPPRLILREEHLAAFQREIDLRFATRMVPYLRREHPPAAALSEAEVERRVLLGMARARRRGVSTPEGLVAFVSLAFRFGLAFDAHPHVEAHLAAESPPDVGVRRLLGALSAEQWDEVRRAQAGPSADLATPDAGRASDG